MYSFIVTGFINNFFVEQADELKRQILADTDGVDDHGFLNRWLNEGAQLYWAVIVRVCLANRSLRG